MINYCVKHSSDALGFDVIFMIDNNAAELKEQTDDIGVAKLKGHVLEVEVTEDLLEGVYIETDYQALCIDLLPGLKRMVGKESPNPYNKLLNALIKEAETALREAIDHGDLTL